MPSKPVIAALSGAALLIVTPFVAHWEGKKNVPYRDVGGVMTVCYGETRVPMKTYSDQECMNLLTEGLKEFQTKVESCVPTLRGHPYQSAAATSLAYNIGTGAFCSSTAARKFKAGDFKGGCEALKSWVYVKKQKVQGLINRRNAEYNLCMTYL